MTTTSTFAPWPPPPRRSRSAPESTSWRAPFCARSRRAAAGLPQRLPLMMPRDTNSHAPVKIMLDHAALPPVEDLAATITAIYRADRFVAVHCVTRLQLVIASPPGSDPTIVRTRRHHSARARLPTTSKGPDRGHPAQRCGRTRRAVTSRYRTRRLPHLYRCRTLLDAGTSVIGGTNGRPDPWAALHAAVQRELNPEERITPRQALNLFLGRPSVAIGDPADLVSQSISSWWVRSRGRVTPAMLRRRLPRSRSSS
jgi:hypothetical protein